MRRHDERDAPPPALLADLFQVGEKHLGASGFVRAHVVDVVAANARADDLVGEAHEQEVIASHAVDGSQPHVPAKRLAQVIALAALRRVVDAFVECHDVRLERQRFGEKERGDLFGHQVGNPEVEHFVAQAGAALSQQRFETERPSRVVARVIPERRRSTERHDSHRARLAGAEVFTAEALRVDANGERGAGERVVVRAGHERLELRVARSNVVVERDRVPCPGVGGEAVAQRTRVAYADGGDPAQSDLDRREHEERGEEPEESPGHVRARPAKIPNESARLGRLPSANTECHAASSGPGEGKKRRSPAARTYKRPRSARERVRRGAEFSR